jgi:hypothetical protein
VYDWIVDIDLLTNVASKGWRVIFSKSFYDRMNQSKLKKYILGTGQTDLQTH